MSFGKKIQGTVAAGVLAALLLPSSVLAADTTLYDSYKKALGNYEVIAIAREAIVAGDSRTAQAYSAVLPHVSAEANYTRYSEDKSVSTFLIQPDSSTRFDLRVEQLLFNGGRERSAIKAAKKISSASRVGLDAVSELVLMETARSFYGVLRASREVEIKLATLKRAREQEQVSRARLAAGTATKTLVLRAEAEVAGTVAELTRAENELKNSKERLRRLTGGVGETTFVEPPVFSPPLENVEALVKIAMGSRRDFKVRELEEAAAGDGVAYAMGGFSPTLKVEGAYSYRDQSPETTFLLNDSVYGGVTLSYALFQGGLKQAELDEARSRERTAELEKIGLRRDIEVEVRESYNNMVALASVSESLEKQLDFAKENYDMVFKQFSYGLADNMDLIDADTTLVEAERGYMNAVLDHQLSVLELRYSTGMLYDSAVREMGGRVDMRSVTK